MPDEIFDSEDGSHSILSDQFGVSYHSKYGAIAESQHVFIDAGLSYQQNKNVKEIRILEMGFGTGLNALMAYNYALSNTLSIDYFTFEKFPLAKAIYSKLNYLKQLSVPHLEQEFELMHTSLSKETVSISERFTFTKYLEDIITSDLPQGIDIIFFDAFAPNSQPELWDEKLLSRLYDSLNSEGILTTYCAKGSFKRALKSVGFTLDSIPGPHGKREMTRAIKNI